MSVPSSEFGPPHPLSRKRECPPHPLSQQARVSPPPEPKGGGGSQLERFQWHNYHSGALGSIMFLLTRCVHIPPVWRGKDATCCRGRLTDSRWMAAGTISLPYLQLMSLSDHHTVARVTPPPPTPPPAFNTNASSIIFFACLFPFLLSNNQGCGMRISITSARIRIHLLTLMRIWIRI